MVRSNRAVELRQLWPALGLYIGRALQVARILASMSQEDLAEALRAELGRKKVRQSYVSRVEQGHCSISWERLGIICKLLCIAPNEVVRMAESIAEDETKNEKELLRNLHAEIARELVRKADRPSRDQEKLLRTVYAEVKRRLSATTTRHRPPSSNGKQASAANGKLLKR